MGDTSIYYKDSMTIVNKAVELKLVKILIIFIAIDLSNNRFYGEISDSVGNLKALIVLNLSSNYFMSHIPSSLGHLINVCCANNTPGLKSITVNKQKLNNKHTQRIQEFTWFGKLPTSTETTEKFHYKK